MGFILLAIGLIVLGIVLNYLFDDIIFGGVVSIVFGVVMGLICVIALFVVGPNTVSTRIHYSQDSTFVANACNNQNLTEQERLQAINYAIRWNTAIGENKYYRHNFWWKWLCKDIENLPLMDISKISQADNKLTIENVNPSKEGKTE